MRRHWIMRVFYNPTTSLRLSSCTEFKGFMSSSKGIMESLWEQFFRDPTQFYDVRKIKKSHGSPDFRHKCTGKALWINGSFNPPWVRPKLQMIDLAGLEVKVDDDREAIMQLIKSCGKKKDIPMMRKICAEKDWINQDIAIATTLIRSYAKCGAFNEARKIFEQLRERDTVCWNALIAGYADQGFGEEALICFRQMEQDRVAPDSVTYISSLKACGIARDLEIVEEIHALVRDKGLQNKNIVLGNMLVDAYAKCGAVKEAHEVFQQLREPNVVSWTALITGYADQGFGREALTCFREMQRNGVTPNSVTYTCALKACGIVGIVDVVEDIHVLVRDKGLLNKDIVLGNSLVHAYGKCGAVKEAREVFEQLEERNVVSWNALISGYSDQGFHEQALTCFGEMQSDRVTLNSVTYICILKTCSIVGAVEVVEEIHAQVRERGLLSKDIVLGSMLVDSYAKCGAMKKAQKVFDMLGEPDLVSWNALLDGYAKVGCVNDMLELFNRMMMRRIFPDHVSCIALLNGCSHGALLDEGLILFGMMGTFDLAWKAEHYTCMVDLFSRSGRIDMAKCFVVDHTSTLLAFLGACQKWVNVDHARWAFKKYLQLDPNCPNAYVCMSNIYAATGMKKEAEEVEFLRERNNLESCH